MAQTEFLQWLGSTAESVIGIDLRAQPDVVIQMIDQARIKYLEVKVKKGTLDYVKVDDAKGMKRHEYTVKAILFGSALVELNLVSEPMED